MARDRWAAIERDPADRRDVDELFSLAYEELRRLAAVVRRSDAHATINPTALVNEAWLKLRSSPPGCVTSLLHFKRIAARAMRQVLVEAARRRLASKRGGGESPATLDEATDRATLKDRGLEDAHWVVVVDAALEELHRLSPRQAAVIESRFFGGLEVEETATLLGVSEATILRDWRAARAWLARELGRVH